MRSPRSVETVASEIGTENGLLFRQMQYVIPATEFRRLTGHQQVQLGHGASAFGPYWSKCVVGVPRDARPDANRFIPNAPAEVGSVASAIVVSKDDLQSKTVV